MVGFSEVGFDGWPLKGLAFLEIEHGEVQGKASPRSPAPGEPGAGTEREAELVSSPCPLRTASGSELDHPSCRACSEDQGLAVSS